jgi:glutamate dehydrogenase/leucine dehydrogenase
LTTIANGWGKGGSDFDPQGKSDGEVMRFVNHIMSMQTHGDHNLMFLQEILA